jgi:outer membrane protein assembly factor BamA
LETIHANVPAYADQNGRGKLEPIEFDVLQGRSVFSAIRANFLFDTRDHPFLPTRGWYVSTSGELGLTPLGSDYDYQRFDVSASKWWKVSGTNHIFRFQGFAGAMSGSAPFFEQYYVGDFCDFLPPRMLGLNVDSRPTRDFLGTAIHSVRYGHYAAELATEYRVPIYRGHRSVFGIDFFLRAGVFSVINRRDLFDPAPAYKGLQRFPVDVTGNVGFRMDTSAGGLVFSFANALGFIPMRSGS